MAGIPMSRRKLERLLFKKGFIHVRSKGDHNIYKRGRDVAVLPVTVNPLISQKYIRDFNLMEDK